MNQKKDKEIVETNQQDSTEEAEEFKPTKHMVKWLDEAMKLGHTASITEVAEKSGVDRTTWYSWVKNPLFVEWWDFQWKQHLKINRWKLDSIGMKKAQSDYAYWKDMMERVGNIKPQASGLAQQFNVDKLEVVNYAEK